MIICMSCTDYFHLFHLNLTPNDRDIVSVDTTYSRMICPTCIKTKYSFLLYQPQVSLNPLLRTTVDHYINLKKMKNAPKVKEKDKVKVKRCKLIPKKIERAEKTEDP